jgi:hypothetical protein
MIDCCPSIRFTPALRQLMRCHPDARKFSAGDSGIIGRCAARADQVAGLEKNGNSSLTVLGIALLAAVLVGCSTSPSLQASAMLPAVALQMPQRYVVVTLPNPLNPPPAHVASTPRGYDNVAPYWAGTASRRTGREIALSYRLREVSSWPIAVLGVNCIVYELPAKANLEHLLAALARDSRVKSAQPLVDFAVEAQSLERSPGIQE